MKKIAADRNYRMLKRADIGERVLDAPLANPPNMPTEVGAQPASLDYGEPNLPNAIQDAIAADVEYQQFLRDTERCLSMSGGLDQGVVRTPESFYDCHDGIEEEFARKYGQRSFVKKLYFLHGRRLYIFSAGTRRWSHYGRLHENRL